MHSCPVTCIALGEDQLIVSGSSFGTVTISGVSSDQKVAALKFTDRTGHHFARPSRLTSHDYLWYCYIVRYSRDLFFHCFICQRWKYLGWVFWNNLFDSTLGGHKVAVTWPLKPYELQEVGLFNCKLVNSSAPYFLPKLACCVNLLFACSLIFSSPFPGHPQNWTRLLW